MILPSLIRSQGSTALGAKVEPFRMKPSFTTWKTEPWCHRELAPTARCPRASSTTSSSSTIPTKSACAIWSSSSSTTNTIINFCDSHLASMLIAYFMTVLVQSKLYGSETYLELPLYVLHHYMYQNISILFHVQSMHGISIAYCDRLQLKSTLEALAFHVVSLWHS